MLAVCWYGDGDGGFDGRGMWIGGGCISLGQFLQECCSDLVHESNVALYVVGEAGVLLLSCSKSCAQPKYGVGHVSPGLPEQWHRPGRSLPCPEQ